MRTSRLVGAFIVSGMLPLAQAATGDAVMIGTWKYTTAKGGSPRSHVGTQVTIEQAGANWTITLGYGTNVITVYKCASDGSPCTVEVDQRKDLACRLQPDSRKLAVNCTWTNGMGTTTVQTQEFEISEGMLAVNNIVKSDGTATSRTYWFEKL
jgi:hypothetical protein